MRRYATPRASSSRRTGAVLMYCALVPMNACRRSARTSGCVGAEIARGRGNAVVARDRRGGRRSGGRRAAATRFGVAVVGRNRRRGRARLTIRAARRRVVVTVVGRRGRLARAARGRVLHGCCRRRTRG